jgi:hypothetical protein
MSTTTVEQDQLRLNVDDRASHEKTIRCSRVRSLQPEDGLQLADGRKRKEKVISAIDSIVNSETKGATSENVADEGNVIKSRDKQLEEISRQLKTLLDIIPIKERDAEIRSVIRKLRVAISIQKYHNPDKAQNPIIAAANLTIDSVSSLLASDPWALVGGDDRLSVEFRRSHGESQGADKRLARAMEKLVNIYGINAISTALQHLIDTGYNPPSAREEARIKEEEARIKEEGFTISQASRKVGVPATVLVEWSEKGLIPILKKSPAPGSPTYLDKQGAKKAGRIYHRAKAENRQPIKVFKEELKAETMNGSL